MREKLSRARNEGKHDQMERTTDILYIYIDRYRYRYMDQGIKKYIYIYIPPRAEQ